MHDRHGSFKIGVESILPGKDDWWATIYGCWFGKYFTEEHLATALREVGAQFTLFYDSLAPGKPAATRRITDMCRRFHLPFLFNNTYGDIYGPWVAGTGRTEYSIEDMEYAVKNGPFLGVIWDEVEHRQLHHADCGPEPYFLDPSELSVVECYDRMVKTVSDVVERYATLGAASVAEHVFPAMIHLFARAGMIPAPKLLKESFNPIILAIAMGAALQYQRELWAVADLWGVVPFWGNLYLGPHQGAPGHGPDEYISSLLMAYWLGADAVYTEGLYNLIIPVTTTPEEWQDIHDHPLRHRGADNPLVVNYRKKGYVLTVYGKLHRWFVREYLPTHPRPFSFRDVKPEVAIIALPDSTWCRRGASNWVSAERLFGPGGPEKQPYHEAILDLFHVLTHGKVPRDGITFHNQPFLVHRQKVASFIKQANDPAEYPYDDFHNGFCPLNGVVVFDHTVGAELLAGVPLIVCTGEVISQQTQEAVRKCVQQGAKCLALPHLLQSVLNDSITNYPIMITEGKGTYLITEDFTIDAVRKYIEPHLGPADEVRYRFGSYEVRIKPEGDERRLSVSVTRLEP